MSETAGRDAASEAPAALRSVGSDDAPTAATTASSAAVEGAREVPVDVSHAPPETKPPWARLAALVVVLVALAGLGHATGATEYLTRERIQGFMESLGPLGFVLFIALFAIGELVHVPGIVFVLAALVAYGRVMGAGAAFVGALVSVSTAFFVVRGMSGAPVLAQSKRPLLGRMLGYLDRHPIATIAGLRAVFWFLPIINVVLALSRVTFRDFFVGSAIGLVVPVLLAAVAFEWVLAFFGS